MGGGVDNRTRLKVGIVLGFFEAGMPLLGLVIGRSLSRELGAAGHLIGAALLVGAYTAAAGVRVGTDHRPDHGSGSFVLTAFALSIDNLVVGLALGAFEVTSLSQPS